ncbi:GNAT family N-acetyltransferase [Ferruginibacter profundus]
MESIHYLLHRNIDKKKWDHCIANADNGLIYGYSFYLDTMAKQWDALVLNDYEAVMPLTFNTKYRISYLYQPSFTAALGVFGKKITADLVKKFLSAIPEKFKYWDIYLNHGNYFAPAGFSLYERMNYVLHLNSTYEHLYSNFKESTQRNIKKFAQLKGEIKKDIRVQDVVNLSKQQSGTFAPPGNDDFNHITSLYNLLHQQHKAITYGAYSNRQLVASAAFFFDGTRAYYILVGNHPDGKTVGASHALINAFIKDNAGQNLLLDFEGSDIRSLAFFYSSFGATEEKYCGIKLNRLPRLLQFFKK